MTIPERAGALRDPSADHGGRAPEGPGTGDGIHRGSFVGFKITEKARLEFIGEAFNLFNRVNYTSWQTIRYRVVSSTKSGTLAKVLLGDFTTTPFRAPVNVGNTLFSPRQLQLGLKLIW